MEYVKKESMVGFRRLTHSELLSVSGGGDPIITVTGTRLSIGTLTGSGDGAGGLGSGLSSFQFMDLALLSTLDPDAIAEFAGLTLPPEDATLEEQESFTKKLAELVASGFEDYIEKFGDFDLQTADGKIYKASELVHSLKIIGNATLVVEGVALGYDYFNGNADTAAAASFLASFAVAAGLSVAGTPALITVVASWAAAEGVEWLLDGSAAEFAARIVGSFNYTPMIEAWVRENGNIDPYNNTPDEFEFWRNFFNPYPEFVEP